MPQSRLRDSVAGALAVGLALGVSQLIAGLFPVFPSLVEGIGNWVIDNAPDPVKDFAIETFGTSDKLVLLIGITVVSIGLGALVGIVARRRFGVAVAAFAGFALLAAVATAASDATTSVGLAIVPGGAAALAGLAALRALYGAGAKTAGEGETSQSRRSFLIGAGAVFGLAVASAAVGRNLLIRARQIAAGREEVSLPAAARPLALPTAAADLSVDGLTPIIVPNSDFYRIDTAFVVPQVNLDDWRLSVTGMVDRPYEVRFHELLEMRMVERDVTLSCVSNEVGGDLVGNARWLGVPLGEILDRAVVADGAEQVVGRSVDDFTVGFPVEAAYDGRDALVAVGMNGEPLPFEHGFPARLVVAGLYGYVSATKWLTTIELTRWDDFDAYWVPRGWSKEGPVKTQSRIDTPMNQSQIGAGERWVAGVAWAPNLGIEGVEVQLGEDAQWVEAELSEPLSISAWVQWRIRWDAQPGEHLLTVRATDGTGETQVEDRSPAAPSGATGWHTVRVVVEEA